VEPALSAGRTRGVRDGLERRCSPARLTGTLLGVALLGAIGPALTFLFASPYWERALQGAIVLVAVAIAARDTTSAWFLSRPPMDAHASSGAVQ
jgi:hypothetical protein